MFKKLVFASIVATTSSAWADTQTTHFNVLLTITKACSFTTAAADVDFGSHASSATNLQNLGNLYVTCTKGTSYDIGLSAGDGTSSTVTSRKMKGLAIGNTDEVPYSLYREIGRATNWGDTVGVDTVSDVGTGAQQTIPIYGTVPSANFSADSYSDIITATVTY